MIKRLFNIVRSNLNGLMEAKKTTPLPEPDFFEIYKEETEPLAKYYANLEIPIGSGRDEIKTAWKIQMKKYHPDLHGSDPQKKKIAEELTRKLNLKIFFLVCSLLGGLYLLWPFLMWALKSYIYQLFIEYGFYFLILLIGAGLYFWRRLKYSFGN